MVVHWMDGQPAPQAILDLLACNCPRKCELPKCECMANGLTDCENQASIANDELKESADENDDELEDEYEDSS